MSIPESVLKHIESRIQQNMAKNEQLNRVESISGGDINAAYCVYGQHARYFLKLNGARFEEMFACEFRALQVLIDSQSLACPQPFFYGRADNFSFLLMEYKDFNRKPCEGDLGHGLARLHRVTAEMFGWQEDNFIGTNLQTNTWNQNWCEFWMHCRLQAQWQLAEKNGYGPALSSGKQAMFSSAENLLKNHQPDASLLHGDLWSGNKACFNSPKDKCEAIIFDPASYYGDRETDIALTRLFGGFSESFYRAYENAWPLPTGHQLRCTLYQLYHMLNHLNLFGSAYLSSCQTMINKIIRYA